jgi:hypothetical protein
MAAGSGSNSIDVGGLFTGLGGGVSGFFQGLGDFSKAEGDKLEGQSYELAAGLADQNAAFTAQSEAIQEYQAGRSAEQTIGGIHADVAGSLVSTGRRVQ